MVFEIVSNQQFFIPFLFVLAVVFGVLEIANVFRNRPVNMIISLVIAFFAATYQPFTSVLWNYLPTITWFFVAMFFIAFSMEIVGLGKKGALRSEGAEARVIVLGLIIVVFITIGVNYIESLPFISFIGAGNALFIIALVLLFMIFFAAFKLGPKPE